MNEMTVRVPSDDIANLMGKIEEYIRFLRVREYAFLVISGDLAKECAAKHLGMSSEQFESWLGTWRFIEECLKDGKEDYETSIR